MSEKEPKFLSSHDTALRIHNCYVKYKGQVYFAQDGGNTTNGTPVVRIYDPLTKQSLFTLNANDDELDTGHIPLGWFNINTSEAVYAMRAPFRKQKSAISAENSFCFNPIGVFRPEDCYDVSNHSDAPGFLDMLLDRYQPVSDSVKKFNGLCRTHSYVSTPLSKELCLVRRSNTSAIYKGVYSIGSFNGETVVLDERYDNSLNRMMLASIHLI